MDKAFFCRASSFCPALVWRSLFSSGDDAGLWVSSCSAGGLQPQAGSRGSKTTSWASTRSFNLSASARAASEAFPRSAMRALCRQIEECPMPGFGTKCLNSRCSHATTRGRGRGRAKRQGGSKRRAEGWGRCGKNHRIQSMGPEPKFLDKTSHRIFKKNHRCAYLLQQFTYT